MQPGHIICQKVPAFSRRAQRSIDRQKPAKQNGSVPLRRSFCKEPSVSRAMQYFRSRAKRHRKPARSHRTQNIAPAHGASSLGCSKPLPGVPELEFSSTQGADQNSQGQADDKQQQSNERCIAQCALFLRRELREARQARQNGVAAAGS